MESLTELKKQKPIARCGSAWCPGGLTMAKPFLMSPVHVRTARSTVQPTAILAAGAVFTSFQVVSVSTYKHKLNEVQVFWYIPYKLQTSINILQKSFIHSLCAILTPIPPQWSLTKAVTGREPNLLKSILCLFRELVPYNKVWASEWQVWSSCIDAFLGRNLSHLQWKYI